MDDMDTMAGAMYLRKIDRKRYYKMAYKTMQMVDSYNCFIQEPLSGADVLSGLDYIIQNVLLYCMNDDEFISSECFFATGFTDFSNVMELILEEDAIEFDTSYGWDILKNRDLFEDVLELADEKSEPYRQDFYELARLPGRYSLENSQTDVNSRFDEFITYIANNLMVIAMHIQVVRFKGSLSDKYIKLTCDLAEAVVSKFLYSPWNRIMEEEK